MAFGSYTFTADTLELNLTRDVERRRITNVVRVRFERGTQNCDSRTEKRSACLPRQFDHTCTSAHIDIVDFAQGTSVLGRHRVHRREP